MKEQIAKLEIIKNMAVEASVKELCDVLIEILKSKDRKIGFK